jgi:hypothetical protein
MDEYGIIVLKGRDERTWRNLLLQCHFIHHKFHVKLYGTELEAL